MDNIFERRINLLQRLVTDRLYLPMNSSTKSGRDRRGRCGFLSRRDILRGWRCLTGPPRKVLAMENDFALVTNR